jgi:hypothetical protein
MAKKRFPSIILGICFLPFGVLLAWVARSGIIGTIINCVVAFLFGFLVAWGCVKFYKGITKKNSISHETIELIMIKSSLYLLPFIILAIAARFMLGWSTMMPFIATATMSYMASTTVEMNKVGMKGFLSAIIPTFIGSGITMIWTALYSFLF